MVMLLLWGTTAQGPFSASAPLLEGAAGIQPEGTCVSPDTTPTHELPNEREQVCTDTSIWEVVTGKSIFANKTFTHSLYWTGNNM